MPEDPRAASVRVERRRLTLQENGAARAGGVEPDFVAAEAPLTVRVEGHPVAVLMRTPGHDRELAAGFLLTEGVIRSKADVFEISLCPSVQTSGGPEPDGSAAVDVVLANPAGFDPERLSRHVFTSSGCGVCGKTTIDASLALHPPLPPPAESGAPPFDPAVLFRLPGRLREAQPAFETTGGLHACALFTREGELISLYEDVGRHNALDKLLGRALLDGRLPLSDDILLLSGRISFELVQKALAGGIPLVAAIGAPSGLALDFARRAGVTVCGFLRENRVNVYTCPERLTPVP